MAQHISSALSTPNNAESKKGRPNQSVAAIREMAARENEKAKLNYEKGMDSLKKLRDPNKSYTSSITAYSKENIIAYLQNIANQEKPLREVVHYMYYRSQIFFRTLNWYASIWDLRCRKVTPDYKLVDPNDDKAMLRSFEDTLNMLDNYKVHESMYAPLLRCYLDDVVYALWFVDDTGAFPYILNPEWCKITGRYMTGDLAFAVNMSKYNNPRYMELIEWLGSPLKEMYEEYKRSGNNYIQVPDEYALCFKYRIDDLEHCISPFVPILSQLASLNDLEDIQDIADEQSIFKLIVCAIKTLSGTKIADDWQITPDLVLEYIDRLNREAFPKWSTVVPILGDGLEVLDFSKNVSDTDVNRIKNAQSNIMNVSGGGAVLAANNITSTAAFNAWLKSESEFAISSLMPQVTGFVNRMLSYDVKNPSKVDFFEVTVLTKDELRKNLLEANQFSLSMRLAYATLLGFSEKETLASLYLETELLHLQDKMIYPLQSSYTQSASSSSPGAPMKDDSELSPEGERSRNR